MKYRAKSNEQAKANQRRQKGSGRMTKRKSNNHLGLGPKPQMESALSLATEWVSVKEMKAFQSVCSCPVRMIKCEKNGHDWQRYLREKKKVLLCEFKLNEHPQTKTRQFPIVKIGTKSSAMTIANTCGKRRICSHMLEHSRR